MYRTPGSFHRLRVCFAVLSLAVLLSACVDPFSDCPLPENFDAALVTEVHNPSGGHYSSAAANRYHRIYRPSASARPQLVVHLPGLSNEPENHTQLIKTAAYTGFRAIALVWRNETLASDDCATAADFNVCLDATRTERGFGGDAQSVQSELATVLSALNADHPLDGWADFLNGGLPAWEKIILTGYSEGGNQSAFMAKQVRFNSVILISGGGNFGVPPPNSTGDPIADWLNRAGATSGSDHFVLYHTGEPFSADYVAAYDAIGVTASSFSRVPEDQTPGWPGFGLAARLVVHNLTTPANPVNYPRCDPHGSTVPDSCLDFGLGAPTYDLMKAHTYLFCLAGSR